MIVMAKPAESGGFPIMIMDENAGSVWCAIPRRSPVMIDIGSWSPGQPKTDVDHGNRRWQALSATLTMQRTSDPGH